MRGTDPRRLAGRAVFLALLLCSACTAIGTAQPKLQDFKTVGIISAIGDTLTLTSSGLTSKNEEQSLSIEPWGIDDLITSRASAVLTRHYQVQPVTYDRGAFVAAYKRDNPVVAVNMVHNLLHENPIKDLVRKQAAPQGLDAYVVVTKAPSAYGFRGRKVAGIGIIKYARLLDSYIELYALYKISVVDGHAFKMIAERSASPLDNTESVRLEGPSRLVDDALLPAANDAASNEPLKAAVIDLIERSLPVALEGLRLTDPS
jgi:hypothetical protein